MIDQSALFKANQEITIFNLVAPTIQFMLPMILLPQVRRKRLFSSNVLISDDSSLVNYPRFLSLSWVFAWDWNTPSHHRVKMTQWFISIKYKLAQWKVITEIIRPFNTWIKGHDVRIVFSTRDVDWCKM